MTVEDGAQEKRQPELQLERGRSPEQPWRPADGVRTAPLTRRDQAGVPVKEVPATPAQRGQ